MLHKTRGIVLNYLKYRETSIIVRIYTEAFGLQSYIVNGVRSKKAKYKVALFQPLTLLDMVVYRKEGANLQRLSEVKCEEPFKSLPFDFKKSSISLFLTEVLAKAIKGEEVNEAMFNFLFQSILIFDHLEDRYENFHLQFLLKLSKYLGFGPESAHAFFDELFVHANAEQMALEEKAAVEGLLQEPYQNTLRISNSIRREILDMVLKYYKLHIENFKEINSLTILKEVMS